MIDRREFTLGAAAGLVTAITSETGNAAQEEAFALRYLLPSCMYGYAYIDEILPEVAKCGCEGIDLWPRVHGNQREQLDDLGIDRFRQVLSRHQVGVRCLTQYPFTRLKTHDLFFAEVALAKSLGVDTIVTGGRGPKGLAGNELKTAVQEFIEELRPVIDAAQEAGVRIAIENHGNNLIESPDSLRYLAELAPSSSLAIAFAPYHLEQDADKLGKLVGELGNSIAMFYAWQHGEGCMEKLPKEQEMLQLPGHGDLDFGPMLVALKSMNYQGWTEVFMHPVPRGVSILPSIGEVTAAINRSRAYLDQLVA